MIKRYTINHSYLGEEEIEDENGTWVKWGDLREEVLSLGLDMADKYASILVRVILAKDLLDKALEMKESKK